MFRKSEDMVGLAWGITVTMFFLGTLFVGGNWVGASGKILIPYFDLTIAVQAYFMSIVVVLASIATSLALGVKNLLTALLLASPGGLFLFLALAVMVFSAKFIDERPITASMLFFLISAIGAPLLFRLCKEEKKRQKIYQGALLLMIFLATISLFFAWG
jgi:hypothetical protein